MKKWLPLFLIIVFISFVWGMATKSISYSEPQEALLAVEDDLLLIPGYKINDKALFFFINNTNNLGAAYVGKGFFGWRAGFLTWGSMDIQKFENLNSVQGHAGSLYYGLIRDGHEGMVKVGEMNATILDLTEILPRNEVEKFQLEGLYIWYVESDEPLKGVDIRLLDKNTGEEIGRRTIS